MKTLVFLPDTNRKSGFGHFYRCLKYSYFLNTKFKIIFLINDTFDKKILFTNKINFICYQNYSSMKKKLHKFKESVIFLDSYYFARHKLINKNNYFYKTIAILDYKIKSSCNILIDHTFLRKKNYYKTLNNNQKFFAGHNYFPIKVKNKQSKKSIVLIDLGSVKNNILINKCLKIFNKLFKDVPIQIIIINKYYPAHNLNKFSFINKIKLLRYSPNIYGIYTKTLFSIGGCGISLYEKCFFGIPTFAKSFAKNQDNNFKNFLNKNCIYKIEDILKANDKKIIFELINILKPNLKKNFSISENKKIINSMFDKI